jgi:hypothetical protein
MDCLEVSERDLLTVGFVFGSPVFSAASLARRSSLKRTVRSRTALACASYSAIARAPSTRCCSFLNAASARARAGLGLSDKVISLNGFAAINSGRPRVSRELRDLIRRMSKENPLWGAPRIHGELLKLGFDLAESTVSKYMIRHRESPSQTWRTFLRNHADAIAGIDLCVVPTLTFERLFAFLVLGHGRRQLLWFAVTRHPTAEWLAQQIVEAFPWDSRGVRGGIGGAVAANKSNRWSRCMAGG